MRRDALLIQQADGAHTYLLNLTVKDHADYCRRFDFDYWPVFGSALVGKDATRHAFWNKVALLRKAVEAGYKYIVWLDSDCWIADDTRDLREACPEDGFGLVWHGKGEWPEGPECYDHFNCGAIYLGNGTHAERLLKRWWLSHDDNHPWHDQHAFNAHALPDYEKGWKKPAPVVKLGYEWNSVPFDEFNHPRPVVAAWHGYCYDLGQRLDAMMQYIQATKLRRMVEGCDLAESCQKADYCMSVGNYENAAQFFERAAELGENGTDFLREYANCHISRKRWQDAVPLLRRAVEAQPTDGTLWRMLSGCYDFLGEHDLNFGALLKARECCPNAPAVKHNEALWKLREGKWYAGFKDLKWDFAQGSRQVRCPGVEWDGFHCDTLFAWAEQGIGDTLMLWRFLCHIANDGWAKKIYAEVQTPLVPLLQGQHPLIEVVPQTPERSISWRYDAHIGMFSLPGMLAATPESVQEKNCPYIKPPEAKSFAWGQAVAREGLKIGFSWAGSQGHGNNVNRNMQAELFDEIVQTPGTSWYSLQHGIEIPQEAIDITPHVQFIGQHCQDMADTAGILANLDLVITVDSAIAHLAGAMGVPCWILLSKSSDWRWLLDRDDSVWYESVRLFRQDSLGDWEGVMRRVQAVLEANLADMRLTECLERCGATEAAIQEIISQ